MASQQQLMPQSYQAPQAGPQSQIRCGRCAILLLYPQGASNVRCSQCGHITPVSIPGGPETAQLVCSHCRMLLVYPRGANTVQCSICHTLNPASQANQVAHVVCGGCRITLMYAYGAQSVKCAMCNFVTQVPQTQPRWSGQGTSTPSASTSGAPKSSAPGVAKTTVVVENPPSIDEEGNEVQNIAVGVKTENDDAS